MDLVMKNKCILWYAILQETLLWKELPLHSDECQEENDSSVFTSIKADIKFTKTV